MGVNAQEYGYFFNSNNSDRTYNAESFESWIKPLMSNGVFGTGMQVSAQSTPDMSVSVAAGYANINGKIGAWPTANTMTIATASGVYPRWDVIVLRRDNTNRRITLEVKTGTASLTPSAPAPTRDADIYELVLAQIYVTAGTTSITNANIVDKRTDTSLCGLVTCPVVNPDFTGLYAQFTQQFQDWFDHMKDQLDDDAAGHLQLEIDDIKADIGIVEDTDTATHTIAKDQYVIWKGSLYKATTAIPATTALSLSNLTAVSNGLGGEVASLNGKITNLQGFTTVTFTPASGVTSDLFVRRYGRVVCVNGYVTSNTAFGSNMLLGTIESGNRPVAPLRAVGGVASAAYSVGDIAYVTIGDNGEFRITAKSGNTYKVCYLSVSYVVQS